MKVKLILPSVMLENGEASSALLDIQEGSGSAYDFLKSYLGDKFDLLFNFDGTTKGFARVFYNNDCIDNLCQIILSDGGEIEVLASMSGG